MAVGTRRHQTALERAVGELAAEEVLPIRVARIAVLAADHQHVTEHLDVDVLCVYAGQENLAVKFLVLVVDIGLNRRRESRGEWVSFVSRGPAQEAVEYLIEFPAEIGQILDEVFTRY